MTIAQSQAHQQLISSSITQFDDGDFREAVVLAHIAIEMVADQTLGRWIETVEPIGLQAWLLKQVENNHNLGTTKALKLYESLSSDMISESQFWPDFVTGNHLRNDIMHEGADVSREQAESVIKNAQIVIEHLLSSKS